MLSLQPSIEILQNLISYPSVSSTSNLAVSGAVSEHLDRLGFRVEESKYTDSNGVTKVNLIGRRDPQSRSSQSRSSQSRDSNNASGGLAYFCHTDVVPAVGWTGPGGDPFSAVIQDSRIYGRGSCDMKGSLVAMLAAAERVNADQQQSPLWIVCTADEEVGFRGAKDLVQNSASYREIVASQPLAIIGEPTRLSVVHAHKGIVGLRITSRGRAAHSSTTDGINANEAIVPMLQTLLELDQQARQEEQFLDHRFDPPFLSWNFGVSDGCSAINITPEKSVAWVSLRPMPEIDGQELIDLVADRAESLGLEFREFDAGSPFWIDPDAPCVRQLCELAGGQPRTVCYGTDGGEFVELQQRVVCGPGDIAQAHTTDEWLELEQFSRGIDLYEKAIRRWCVDAEV